MHGTRLGGGLTPSRAYVRATPIARRQMPLSRRDEAKHLGLRSVGSMRGHPRSYCGDSTAAARHLQDYKYTIRYECARSNPEQLQLQTGCGDGLTLSRKWGDTPKRLFDDGQWWPVIVAHGPPRLNGGGNQILTGYPRSARFASGEGSRRQRESRSVASHRFEERRRCNLMTWQSRDYWQCQSHL